MYTREGSGVMEMWLLLNGDRVMPFGINSILRNKIEKLGFVQLIVSIVSPRYHLFHWLRNEKIHYLSDLE